MWHRFKKDRILWRVFKNDDSWYDRYSKRLCVEDDHQLNFFAVDTKVTSDVKLELELGPQTKNVSEKVSCEALDHSEHEEARSQAFFTAEADIPVGLPPPAVPPQKAMYMTTAVTRECNVKF